MSIMPQDDKPPSTSVAVPHAAAESGLLGTWLRKIFKPRNNGDHLREALEEYIEEMEETDGQEESVASHERLLISNILKIRDMTAVDVMIPRADITSVDVDSTAEELMELLSEKQVSRIPVYRDTLDDVIGSVHIKDILACVAAGRPVRLPDLVRDVPIVSPAMAVLDLLLLMKESRKHMVLVVDEFGGIDGLATIGDVIEAIVGEVEDEFDTEEQPQMMERPDGTLLADARLDIEEFEEKFGQILTEDEREDVDTLGGLIFSIAGRVPARGEVIRHESGMVFEIIDADPRRVNTLRIKNIPKAA
jgi:CBS domain containing-hemolysin-like protein